MCESLMNPQEASSIELQAAIDRKVQKFGAKMPAETNRLVQAAKAEIERRSIANDAAVKK